MREWPTVSEPEGEFCEGEVSFGSISRKIGEQDEKSNCPVVHAAKVCL